ncbi:MAG: sensor histidine kinase [Verrucomicrobiota bacterium]
MTADRTIAQTHFTGLVKRIANPSLVALRRRPPWITLLVALALVGVIGWMDRVTGWEWNFSLCYALPIVLAVWRTGKRTGISFAMICTAAWWAADVGDNPYQTSAGFAVAMVSRLFYFVVLAIAAAAVKEQQTLARTRITSLEREQELERLILVTSEREQQRVGRDLHDGLGAHLAAVGYAAAFLANDLRPQHPAEAVKADRIREMISNAISLTRDLARGIYPVKIEGDGLAIALEELARNADGLTTAEVAYSETGTSQVEDPEIGMHLYRIAQEALANALKHSGARKITLALNQFDGSLDLVVTDDGSGMAAAASDTASMGLSSMKYRARAIGGVLTIRSAPDHGTLVSCKIQNPPPRPTTSAP